MRIIHLNGFTTDELWARRSLIFMNVVEASAQLLNGSRRLGFNLTDIEQDAKKIFDMLAANDFSQNFPHDICIAIKSIWAEPKIQEIFNRRNEFYLMDCARYFIESVDRISEPDYIPTIHDILYSRVETIGVSEIRYNYKNTEFRIFDVGGQKTQRRKWIHIFDNVNALFYIAAISEYDLVLREDGVTNRLQDALLLFKSIGNNEMFRTVQIILFLNKKDLFAEKIGKIPLTACFPNYKYKNDYKNGTLYITRKFEQQIIDKQKMIYTHLTCATDTDHVQFVMNSITDMIIAENFKQTGVI
uniref:Uncharacterized protein n=1 Tax=Acrobeloides nanus TaxID=290746 RepID=A0A914CP03_9BILA